MSDNEYDETASEVSSASPAVAAPAVTSPAKSSAPPAAGPTAGAASHASSAGGGGSGGTATSSNVVLLSSETATLASIDFVRCVILEVGLGRVQYAREMLSKALRLCIDDALDGDLAQSAIVDAYVDLVAHFLSLRYSDRQIQQLLSLQQDVLAELASFPAASPTFQGDLAAEALISAWAFPLSPGAGGHAPRSPMGSKRSAASGQPTSSDSPNSSPSRHGSPSEGSPTTSQHPSTSTPLGAMLRSFSVKLQKLCARRTVMVDELIVSTETVAEDIPDPAVVAQLEQQQAAALAKKGAGKGKPPAPIDLSTVPKITIYKRVVQENVVRHDVAVDPTFDAQEMRRVASYFEQSVFQHWRLFHHALTVRTQDVSLKAYTLYIQDLPLPTSLPPLASAVTAAEHERNTAQHRMFDEAAAVLQVEYDNANAERDEIAPAYAEATAAAWTRYNAAVASDLAQAMSPQEYERTVKALSTALMASSAKRADIGVAKRLERLETSAPVPAAAGAPAASGVAGKPADAATAKKK